MKKPATSPARRNVSAFDRLRQLPALFRGSDLTVRLQWSSKKTSHYLWLWKKRNLVQPLGGHSDVFANLVVDARPNWEGALLLARPSAVIVGIECLRRAGWTTQVPHRPEVAIDNSLPMISTEHFDVVRRPLSWFESIEPGLLEGEGVGADPASRTVPALRPAWALADLLARADPDSCGLTPDDIDWSEIEHRERKDWIAAAAALGVAADGSDAMPTDMMREAVAKRRSRQRRAEAARAILEERDTSNPVSSGRLDTARRAGRS